MTISSETKWSASKLLSCSIFLWFARKSCHSSHFGRAWFKLEIFLSYLLSTLPLDKTFITFRHEGWNYQKQNVRCLREGHRYMKKAFFAHKGKIGGLAFLIEIILTTVMASTMDVWIAVDGPLEGFIWHKQILLLTKERDMC